MYTLGLGTSSSVLAHTASYQGKTNTSEVWLHRSPHSLLLMSAFLLTMKTASSCLRSAGPVYRPCGYIANCRTDSERDSFKRISSKCGIYKHTECRHRILLMCIYTPAAKSVHLYTIYCSYPLLHYCT